MSFKNLLKTSCFITLCFFIVPAMAQNRAVTGNVKDSKDGSPIPGVSISAKGTSAVTVTDIKGAFKLSVPASSNTLVITNIDYNRKEVEITGAPLNISLEPSGTFPTRATGVNFGYGVQRKQDVSGAVATLTTEEFNQGAIFNPAGQLAGKVAGLTITQPGGDPNQTVSIQIRGRSSLLNGLSPLFVVDGVILDDAAQFQKIPPNEIASYEILKDVSATAIYGSRAANGVIIVTTKKGQAGRATIAYDGLAGTAMQSKYYDLLNAAEYSKAIEAIPGVNPATYELGGNTDWQKAISRTAYLQNHNVSISQGTNTFNYIASADYQNQQGVVINSGKEQLGLRFSGELKAIGDKLDIKAGIQNVNTTRKLIDYSNFGYAYNSPPTYSVKNPDGSYHAYVDFNLANPVEHLSQEILGDKEYLTLANASVDYAITRDLKVGVLGSASFNKIQFAGFIPSFPSEGNMSQELQADENTHSYKGDIHINYNKSFGKSTLNLLGSYEYNDYRNNISFSNTYSNGLYRGSSYEDHKLMSFIGRAAYNYDDHFYATATLRRDEASTPGPDKLNGYFPSLSLAYGFKKDLFTNTNWISDIKLRAGYGIAGNSINQNGNPLFQWERMQGRNIGLDFSLFNGRLSGDVNYFNNLTKNLLFNYPVPSPPFPTNTLLANGGTLTNKGLELYLSAQLISGHKLNWTVNGQITFIRTTITSLSAEFDYNGQPVQSSSTQIVAGYAEGRGLSSSPITFLKVGYSPYVFFLPHYTGVDAQGNETFDGQTLAQNPSSPLHYIDPSPKFNYGVTNSFDYGNWNLSFTLRGVYGQKIFNNTLLNIETITRLPSSNVTREALTNGIKDGLYPSDKWLEGASFLRMDNATLGYSFKNVSFARVLRVFISTNNLFVITKYKGLDPEVRTENSNSNNNISSVINTNGNINQAYIDSDYNGKGYYPAVRAFSLGVNISLK
jgi:TonB-dependent SusC/RagA subfamily outer membrane receptor